MNALVIGYGSAGKRHAQELTGRGYEVVTVDTDVFIANHDSVDDAVRLSGDFDICVIASPPNTHLDYMIECLQLTTGKVICEKPFYDTPDEDKLQLVSVLSEDRDVFVTYNYRFHKQISGIEVGGYSGLFEFYSRQYRNRLPSWGFLLDHIPHTVDIAFSLIGAFDPTSVSFTKEADGNSERLSITLMDGDLEIRITDIVLFGEGDDKVSYIATPDETVILEHDAEMFPKMWNAILGDEDCGKLVDIYDAVLVNNVIDRIKP